MANLSDDVKLKLLAGLGFDVDGIGMIEPLKLIDIVKIGYSKYEMMLGNLIFDVEDLKNEDLDINNLDTFTIIASNILYGKSDEYTKMILDAFKFFLKREVSIFNDGVNFGFMIGQDSFIDKYAFEDIKKILKWQNCVKKESDEFANCINSKAEEIKQKILKGRKSLVSDKEQIHFSDLVSAVAAHGNNNLNIINIWDITMYQFNNQFARMQMIEDYDINIRSLLAGAKSEDIKLTYYIRKINANNQKDDSQNKNKNISKNIAINKVNKIN
jgi:hypothetical protein